MTREEWIKIGAKLELARRDFFTFCNLLYPKFFKKDRQYLRDLCDTMQEFYEDATRMLVINLPPRFGKSFAATLFVCWMLGINKNEKIMTGSYNQTLSGTFAENVRNIIMQEKVDDNIVYSDIFPDTKIKYGDAAKTMWSLDGCSQKSYLSTSPSGSATGFGATFEILDDLIKSAEEAYNDTIKDNHFEWFKNTMLSRQEGKRKILIIMTRWATNDLAGRCLEEFKDIFTIKHINMKVEDNGKMLCDDVLDRESWEVLKKTLNPDILSANYLQEAIDIKGRLYTRFNLYDAIPDTAKLIRTVCDTADTGKDYLCSITFAEDRKNDSYYLVDVIHTQEPPEVTEGQVAKQLYDYDSAMIDIESNNGGRQIGRNIVRILKEKYDTNIKLKSFTQNKNKESRILANSTEVMNKVYYPRDWRDRWPSYYKEMNTYNARGKNEHDDAVDATTMIIERCKKGMSVLKPKGGE